MSKNKLKLFTVKLLLVLFVLSLLFIAACSNAPQAPPQPSGGGSPVASEVPAKSLETTKSVETVIEPASQVTKTETATEKKDSAVKEFTMTANNWKFEPDTITVNKDDKVKITVTALDKNHGISIWGINKKLEPNKPEVIEFTADQTGEFPFFCTVFCGSGHSSMKGKVIVK